MSAMKERWRHIDRLFQSAIEIQEADRDAFLEKACAGQTYLRSEVESLIVHDAEEWRFLETPAVESGAALLSEEDPLRFAPGAHIGHYEIVGLLGTGGMGEVYRAKDHVLNRMVALKLLPLDYTSNANSLKRFQREAQTVSALNHPNIITIFELGTVDGQQFIATELVEGETLRSRVSRAGLSLSDALDIGIQTAEALAASHRAGIVHRDIKPENIMLRSDGYVKVVDFGLAKLLEEPAQAGHPDATLTKDTRRSSEFLMGTLRYMSPEQLRGEQVDGRSDIYSLGVLLYELVAGHAPFCDREQDELIKAILNDDLPDPGVDGIPKRLTAVIARATRKERTERYRDASGFADDLKQLRQELGAEGTGGRLEQKGVLSRIAGSLAVRPAAVGLVFIPILAVMISTLGYAMYSFLRTGSTSPAPLPTVGDTGAWAAKAPISSPRWQAAPAVIDDVLYVVGGWNVCTPFSDLERYDPRSDTWSRRAPIPTARGGHGVGVLDGKLYAVGGSTDCNVHTASVEAYDAVSDSWSERASLPEPRFAHAVATVNGRLYAIGGSTRNENYLSQNTEYDPATDTWRERAPMPTPRSAAAVAVANGIIYVMGGGGHAGTLATVEAYDPRTDTWTTKRSLLIFRMNFAAAEAGGFVYIFGGGGSRSQVEMYDPKTDTWTEVARMPASATHLHAANLRGSIYLIGGFVAGEYRSGVIAFTPQPQDTSVSESCPSVEIAPRTGMPTHRSNMTVGEIDGIIYAAGGFDNSTKFLAVNEAYDPRADTWTPKKPLSQPRETRGSNTAAVNGKMHVIGGNASGQCSNLNQVYDPVTDLWETKQPMPTPRCHLAVVANGALVYAIGGTNTNGSIQYSTVEVYDPATDRWTTAPPMPTPRQDLAAVFLDGVLYAIGGGNPTLRPDGELHVVEAYDPAAKTWSVKTPLRTPRTGPVAAVIDELLIVVGGVSSEKPTGSVEAFDPKIGRWTTLTTSGHLDTPISGVVVGNTLYGFGATGPPNKPDSDTTTIAITLKPCSS
jgi:N-acetylneuraminic acid mutarotase